MDHSEARVAFVHETQLDVFNQVKPERLNLYKPTDQQAELHSVSSGDDALPCIPLAPRGGPRVLFIRNPAYWQAVGPSACA